MVCREDRDSFLRIDLRDIRGENKFAPAGRDLQRISEVLLSIYDSGKGDPLSFYLGVHVYDIFIFFVVHRSENNGEGEKE
jgi:hypothetical protein